MSKEKKFQFAFSGKEIFIILSMLIFISILLFTLGVMYGKTGGFNMETSTEIADKGAEDDLSEDFDDDFDDDLDDDLEDFESEDIDVFEKKEEKETLKKSLKNSDEKKSNENKKAPETKLSFYKDLPKEKNKAEEAPSTAKKNRYPMLSDEVLMSHKGKYTVQVAAYIKEKDAETKTLLLKKSCCSSAYYVENEVPGKGIWYQVRVGFFSKLKNAKDFARDLKKNNKIAEYVIKIVR